MVKGNNVLKEKEESNAYPTLFACTRRISPSDGIFFGCSYNPAKFRKNEEKVIPLTLQEKAVRGTQSNYIDKADEASIQAKASVPNIQHIDYCVLPNDMDTLKMTFDIKFFSGAEEPNSCDMPQFQADFENFVKGYIKKTRFQELAFRYAMNIANARFFWRNRVGADDVRVYVSVAGEDTKFEFKSFNFSLHDFDAEKHGDYIDLQGLAERIAQALSGERDFLLLNIRAYSRLGCGQEVFPSQEMVIDNQEKGKTNGRKSRFLYTSFDHQAAMHSQKIGNAIRTIDTWYLGEDQSPAPIAVEPYGSVTNRATAYRSGKNNFYVLLNKAVVRKGTLSDAEEDFVMATILRGGVFGRSKDK